MQHCKLCEGIKISYDNLYTRDQMIDDILLHNYPYQK